MRAITVLSVGARAAAGAMAITRLAKAAKPAPPIEVGCVDASISVVVPARDEAERIGPLLDAVVGAPGVSEVIVVDDQSSDATAAIARGAGARVVRGTPLPDGWAGKAWAVQQGIEAATSEWVVTLDADTRPDPRLPSATVARAITDDFEFLTVGGRFECPTPSSRWLHAAMLTTLVYRFGPPGATADPDRAMANGQCMTLRREQFLAGGGMGRVRGEVVEDIALARALMHEGHSVGFLDASELLTVRMFESLDDVWTGWGRSLALPGVEAQSRQVLDAAVVLLAQALPLPRVLFGRGDLLDVGLLALRAGTLAGTRRAYERSDAAYWLSPTADLGAVAALIRGIAHRGPHRWRGRTYSA